MLIRTKFLLAVGLLAAGASPVLASGVQVSEVDARASGRAGAVSAVYDSPSSIFFNSANITRLPGLQLSLGVSVILPKWGFTPAGASPSAEIKTNGSLAPPLNLSATYNFGDVGYGDVAIGMGFYAPYGTKFS